MTRQASSKSMVMVGYLFCGGDHMEERIPNQPTRLFGEMAGYLFLTLVSFSRFQANPRSRKREGKRKESTHYLLGKIHTELQHTQANHCVVAFLQCHHRHFAIVRAVQQRMSK